MLNRSGCENDVVVMQGRTTRSGQETALRRLVHKHWSLADIDARYAAFVRRFRPVLSAARKKKHKDPRIAFLIRMLLIQDYRKVLLRDPLLPLNFCRRSGMVRLPTSCAEIFICRYTTPPTST